MNHTHLQNLVQRCTRLEKLKQIHGQALKLGLHRHQPLSCAILNLYTKLGKTCEAQNVFNEIENPDIVSWTCLISLYLHADHPGRAFDAFSRLIHVGLIPDSYSVVGALSACGRTKDLSGGRIVHGMIFRYALGSDPIVGNALIHMYSQNLNSQVARFVFKEMKTKDISSWTSLLNGFVLCGDLASARRVFDKMPQRNLISWNAMITGCVHCRNPMQALEFFQQMKSEGNHAPTSITIVAVLSGCADIGALDLGRSIHAFIEKSNSNMNVIVNNTLIDMYSKSGSLDLAVKVYEEMLERDVFSWTTIISGLAFHGLGKHAIKVFDDMLKSGINPNEVTFVSVLLACSHAGLVIEGRRLFHRMISLHGISPKIMHYGCMVDLLCRAGLLEEAKEMIDHMHIEPDAVIWRSMLSACLVHGNFLLAEVAAKKVIELEPEDDGVYILLCNIYRAGNNRRDAMKIRKEMKVSQMKKKPGCSWVEVNGVVHEFLADNKMHSLSAESYSVLEGISKLGSDTFLLKLSESIH